MFIPVDSETMARTVSSDVWNLTRPDEVAAIGDETAYCFGWLSSGAVTVVVIPDDMMLYVHPHVLDYQFSATMARYVEWGLLTVDEVQAIGAYVTTMLGQSVRVLDVIPPSWQARALTADQASAFLAALKGSEP